MREIKFRVWDKENEWMDGGPLWINLYGDLYDVPSRQYDTPNVEIEPADNKYILMQYTGLHDKNGKEIYEGDIVNLNVAAEFGDEAGYRPYKKLTIDNFHADTCHLSMFDSQNLEVIGNIYEK